MEVKDESSNVIDGTSWEFLKTGWWVFHVFIIAVVFYLGTLFG